MESLSPLQNQVAGHTEAGGSKAMMSGHHKIYKPLQSGLRGDRESSFYETLSISAPDFVKFTPQYFGVEKVITNGVESAYLVLEDLTTGIPSKSLNICDIKMGTRTYDDHASEKKIMLEEAKMARTTTKTHGFRFCGMRVYEGEEKGVVKYDKSWGKKLHADSIPSTINNFIHRKAHLIPQIVANLKEILSWFEVNTKLSFFGTSILIVFNGDEVTGADIDEVNVKIIDFAHVCEITEPGKRDDGYIFGLQNLIQYCEKSLPVV